MLICQNAPAHISIGGVPTLDRQAVKDATRFRFQHDNMSHVIASIRKIRMVVTQNIARKHADECSRVARIWIRSTNTCKASQHRGSAQETERLVLTSGRVSSLCDLEHSEQMCAVADVCLNAIDRIVQTAKRRIPTQPITTDRRIVIDVQLECLPMYRRGGGEEADAGRGAGEG